MRDKVSTWLRWLALWIISLIDQPKEAGFVPENGYSAYLIKTAIMSVGADCRTARRNAIRDLGKKSITQSIPTLRQTLLREYDEEIAEALIDSLIRMKERVAVKLTALLHPAYYIRELAAEKLRQ